MSNSRSVFSPVAVVIGEDSRGLPPIANPGGHPVYYQNQVASQTTLQGTTAAIWALDTPLASGESAIVVALVEIGQVGTLGVGGNITLKGPVENVNGTLTNTVSGSTSTLYVDISTPAGANINSALNGASAAIVASGKGLAITVTAPSGVSIWSRANVDVTRAMRPAMQILTASPTTGVIAGGTTVTLTGEGFTGAVAVYLFPVVSGSGGGSSLVSTPRALVGTGLVIGSNSSMSFVTPPGIVGTYNVQVVRGDGNSATLASAFTFISQPAPVVSSISPTSGYAFGTPVTITGTGFTGATSATVCGFAITGMTVVSDTSITGTTAAITTLPGTNPGAVAVTSPAGTGSLAAAYTYLDDPLTILGAANVFAWFEPRVCTQSGGSVTGVTDLSGNGNAPSGITSVGYTASDANFANTPSWNFNGTTSFMNWASPTTPATQAIMDFFVCRMKATTTAAMYSDSGNIWELHENGTLQYGVDGIFATWGTNTGVLNTSTTVCGYGQSGGGSNLTVNITVANGAAVTNTGGSPGIPYPANRPFALAARPGPSIPMNVDIVCWVRAAMQPSGGQLTALQTYAHNRFGV